MDTAMLTLLGIVVGILAAMFLVTYLAMLFIKKKHEKTKFNSLPEGGTDASDFGEMLVQKYQNARIEGDL